jgi:two-component system phosphate regulon sensor histidine kinase PhoR
MENIEMRGRNIIELLRDAELLECSRAALSGTRAEIDAERGGRVYRAYFSPAAGAGAILLLLDITERVKAEKLRKEFSANVSHELKTPLTSVLGCAELLLAGGVDENDKLAFYRKIKSESERLIALIEDIMALSKLDEGKKSEFEKINLTAAAKEAAAALSDKAANTGVKVEVNGEDFFIRGNYSMAVELFYNLIDNAIKYNKPGGAATVSVSAENGRVAARVSDTGIGIPKDSQERIFERFYRVDKSRSKKTGGTGLGLAIAKHIAIIHNAEVGVESAEGAGTVVTVFFPPLQD